MTDLFSAQKQPHPDTASHETIFTVAEYISLINSTIKPLKATIQGEIGKIKYYPKAVYFSLFDKDRSVINCMMWISRLQSLGVELKDGLEVKIQGFPEVWSGNGMLTFKADAVIPVGEGALKLAFERLKVALEKDGYFRKEHKRPLPQFVSRIGLITSSSGVVIRDFVTGLGNHGVSVRFYDVRVEGLNAIENIVTAIQWFNEHAANIDVLVIARGGGSLERLQPFNTKEMAKAIYGSRIPVMTAIGHELDVTIADLVADVRASVPMDAGQRLAAPWVQVEERIATIEHNILTAFKAACRALEQKLQAYSEQTRTCYTNRISAYRKQVDVYEANLTRCFKDMLLRVKRIESDFSHNYEWFSRHLAKEKQAVASFDAQLNRGTQQYIAAASTYLNGTEKQFTHNFTRLSRSMESLSEAVAALEDSIGKEAKRWYLAIVKHIADCEAMLQACDPKLKLKQGYSIITNKQGKIIKSSKSVQQHDRLGVQLFEGMLKTKVEEVS